MATAPRWPLDNRRCRAGNSTVQMEDTYTGTPCPWGRWAGWFIAVMMILTVVAVVLDRDASKVLEALSWLTLAVAAITDRQGPLKKRIIPVAVAWVVIVLSAAVAAWFGGDFPAAVGAFVKYQVGVIWLAVLWLSAPVYLVPSWKNLNPSDDNRRAGRFAWWVIIPVLLLAVHGTVSAAGSMFPEDSMKMLGGELLPYAGLFVLITRVAACLNTQWLYAGLRGSWLVVVIACIGMAAVAVMALWSPALSDMLLEEEYLRVDADAPDARRLQFLFHHHNRAGYFAACGIFLALAGAFGGRWWKVLGIAGSAAAAVAVPFTLTRGALVAAAIGMAVFALAGALRNRRARWPAVALIIIGLPALWLALPASYKEHISKIIDVTNYQQGQGGSIGARLVMWETAAEMIERRPGLGFGYGAENFVSAAQADNPDKPDYFEHAAHAHNIWLETAAESGILASLLLLAFTLLRLGGLVRSWWRSMRRRHALAWLLLLWICLEITVQVYGLTNYALRRNLGFLTYWIWGGSVFLVIMAARADMSSERRKPMEMPKF